MREHNRASIEHFGLGLLTFIGVSGGGFLKEKPFPVAVSDAEMENAFAFSVWEIAIRF
jgi:hypothetical protein